MFILRGVVTSERGKFRRGIITITMKLILIVRGAIRLLFGFCPKCNSDAPEIYNCGICYWWSDFPPSYDLRKKWWNEFLHDINNEGSKAWCDCGHEILQDPLSKVEEGSNFTIILCNNCNTQTMWDLDAPVPLKLNRFQSSPHRGLKSFTFPGEAVDRHLKLHGHLPEHGCCKFDQSPKEDFCNCQHGRSQHSKIPYSPNYTEGRCKWQKCSCQHFNIEKK